MKEEKKFLDYSEKKPGKGKTLKGWVEGWILATKIILKKAYKL